MTLNLATRAMSSIGYTIHIFPDGEWHLVLDEYNRKEADEVLIITRITSANDLFILAQACDILKRNGTLYSIKIYYLMSMRMDRVMDFKRSYSLQVVANIINSFKATSVTVIEPHSTKTLRLINNCFSESVYTPSMFSKDYTIVFPDHGAFNRYYSNDIEAVICNKVRDENTGKLLSFEIENPNKIGDKPLLIFDDLCDGGGTFLGIKNKLLEVNPNAKISIAVTHLVNPKGLEKLSNNFEKVYITNSFRDWENLPKNVEMIYIYD